MIGHHHWHAKGLRDTAGVTLIGAFLDRNVELIASETLSTSDVIVMPAGNVALFGMEDVVCDEAAAREVIATFERRGVDVPVDYEHSTRHKAAKGEEAIATGWIKSLRWVPDRGIVGTVVWSERARGQIERKEYRYVSPHFDVDVKTRHVAVVKALALTNTPRICNIEQLELAASLAAGDGTSSNKETVMTPEQLKKLRAALGLEDGATTEEIIAQVEEAVAPEEVSAEDQAVIAVKGLLMEIQRALMEANVIGAEASLADAMQAALDLIGKPAVETDEAMASIAASLGLETGAKAKQIVETINARTAGTVPLAEFQKVKGMVETMNAERKTQEVTASVDAFVAQGRINPNSPERMAWARSFAAKDLKGFETIAAGLPVMYKSDQVTPTEDALSTERKTIIASALKEYNTDNCGASKRWYVNAALSEKDEHALDESEVKALSIA